MHRTQLSANAFEHISEFRVPSATTVLKINTLWVAAIAPCFRLRLPSCGPGFKSQALHLHFFSICTIEIVLRKYQK